MKKTPRSLERRQVRGERALVLDGGRADGAQRHAERVGDEMRQRRLADAGRAGEEHVVERLAAPLRRRDEDLEVLDDLGLADVLVEAARAQRGVVLEESRRRRGAGVTRAAATARDVVARRRARRDAFVVLLAHASTLLREDAQRRFYQLGDAGAGMRLGGVGGGALGLGRLVAEVDQRRGHRLRAARACASRRAPTSARRTCRAARAPCARRSSCRCRGSASGARGRRRARPRPSSSASSVDRIDIASLGPMPCTPVHEVERVCARRRWRSRPARASPRAR